MPTDGLFPADFVFRYSTTEAFHTQTRPIRAIDGTTPGEPGLVTLWNDTSVSTDIMVEAYIDEWLLYQPDTTESLSYSIRIYPEIGEPPVLLYEAAYANPGALAALTGRKAATQHNMIFRTTGGELMQVVSLDRQSGNTYGYVSPLSVAEAAFRDYVLGTVHALAGRDNGRPYTFKNLKISQNDALMRRYGNILP
jgi:hypothetical protein